MAKQKSSKSSAKKISIEERIEVVIKTVQLILKSHHAIDENFGVLNKNIKFLHENITILNKKVDGLSVKSTRHEKGLKSIHLELKKIQDISGYSDQYANILKVVR